VTTMEPRIGDHERDAAVERLREHHAEGRLDLSEFTDRMNRALEARTQSDLDPLFADLPSTPPPTYLPAPIAAVPDEVVPGPANRAPAWLNALAGAAFPIALIICFATGWRFWWVILLPMVLGALTSSWRKGSGR